MARYVQSEWKSAEPDRWALKQLAALFHEDIHNSLNKFTVSKFSASRYNSQIDLSGFDSFIKFNQQ